MKYKDGSSYFYKNKKYRPLEIEKKTFFSYFISKFFYMCVFSGNAQFLSEYSFNKQGVLQSLFLITECVKSIVFQNVPLLFNTE